MSDEELLARLALAFAPDIGAVAAPPPQAMAALHRAVSERGSGVPVGPFRRRWVAALVGLAATLGGATAAFAAGVPIPDPLRDLVHDIGLPIDSSRLVGSRSTRVALESAVARRDAAEAGRLAKALRTDLAKLERDERDQLEPEADRVLEQADALVAEVAARDRAGGGGVGTPQQSAPAASTQPPATQGNEVGPQSSTQSENQASGGSSSAADALLSSASSPFPPTTAGAVTNSQGSGSDTGGSSSGANAS